MLSKGLPHVFRLVVDGSVEAQFMHDVAAFLRSSCNAHGTAVLYFCDLSHQRADSARCCRNYNRVSRLRLAGVEKAKICSHSRHAKHAEILGQWGNFRVDFSHCLAVGQRILLHAEQAGNVIACSEGGLRDAVTIPTPSARISSPMPTGGMYERASLIHMRMAGSSEMYKTRTSSSPSFGSPTGSSMNVQSLRFGIPTGRAASRNL